MNHHRNLLLQPRFSSFPLTMCPKVLPDLLQSLPFSPNRSLDPEQISLDCWADCFSLVRRRSGLRRERTKNKMPTRKWKMTGSYLFNYESYYNGLMTDWGLVPRLALSPPCIPFPLLPPIIYGFKMAERLKKSRKSDNIFSKNSILLFSPVKSAQKR